MSRPIVALLVFAAAACTGSDAPRDGITITAANHERGIAGTVVLGDARIDFTSRLDARGELVAMITDTQGRELWRYRERPIGSETPTIVIGGEPYRPDLSADPSFDQLSEEEQLAQLLQLGFNPAVENQIAAIGELAKPIATADYRWSDDTGYVVLTQHPRAHFHRNLVYAPLARDDGHRVSDECYGHCGGGCGNTFSFCGNDGTWSHHESDESIGLFEWIEDLSCGWYRKSTWDRLKYWHSFTGGVSNGCIAHDWCCRTQPLGCWNPLCLAIMPVAIDQCVFTWYQTWSYWDIRWKQVSDYEYWFDENVQCQ